MRTSIAVAAIVAVVSTVAAYEYEEDVFAREADAEPILGLNHMGKWIGEAVGSVKEGYNIKAHGSESSRGNGYDSDYNSQRRRDIEDLEELLFVRDADAEPILGLNHLGKWAGEAVGSIKQGFSQKANAGMDDAGYTSQSQQYRRDLDTLEILLAIRDAEAEAEPILGLNHLGKWAGEAVGSIKQGFNMKANSGMASYSENSIQMERRSFFDDDEFDF